MRQVSPAAREAVVQTMIDETLSNQCYRYPWVPKYYSKVLVNPRLTKSLGFTLIYLYLSGTAVFDLSV